MIFNMKKILFLLFLIPLSISTFAQTTKIDAVVTQKSNAKKLKMGKKTKAKSVEINKASDTQISVAKAVVNEPDTLTLRYRFIDTTFFSFFRQSVLRYVSIGMCRLLQSRKFSIR